MKFRPLHDRVLVRRVAQEEKTSGGIIIPDTAQEKPMEGEIVAVGPGAYGDDFTFRRLLLSAVGNDDAALGLLQGGDAADDQTVVQGAELGLGHRFPRRRLTESVDIAMS